MKLIRLQAFKEVMETGSVTGASVRLKCSQPRVSRLISELEDEIGFLLFRREKQRLHPTQEGLLFFNEARRMLQGIDNINQVANDIYNKRETGLRILTQSHIAQGLLNRVIGEFDKIKKDIRFNVVVKPREELTKWLGGHQFDIAFTALPATHPLVRHQKLVSINLMAALPNEHPLSRKKTVTIQDLATIPVITLPNGLPMRSRINKMFRSAGIELNVRIETPTVFSACQLVSRGMGATLTGPFTASLFTKDDFTLCPLSPLYVVDYGVLYLKQEPPRLLVRQFIDVAQKVAIDLNGEVGERL